MSIAATLVNPLVDLATERGADHLILAEGRPPLTLKNGETEPQVVQDYPVVTRLEMVEYQHEVGVRHGDEFIAGTIKQTRRVRLTVENGQITQKLFMSLTFTEQIKKVSE